MKKNNNLKKIVDKRIKSLKSIIYVCFIILICYMGYIFIFQKEYYSSVLAKINSTVYEYANSPRGRIYDRNHNLIVDNKEVAVIAYLKPSRITPKEEVKSAKILASIIDLSPSKATEKMLKEYWLIINSNLEKSLVKEEEWEEYYNRNLNDNDIYNLKMERIPKDDISSFGELDRKAAYIYYLMNNGYSYNENIIKKKNLTEEEIAVFTSYLDKLPGFYLKYDWERTYPYGDTFRSILGNISSISKEDKDYYLAKGYSLNDLVGASFLEKEYEDILKGEKGTYRIENDRIVTVSEGTRGNDIVLTIDINLQREVEKILEEELIRAKSEPSTSLFNQIYVVIQEPKTGEILAMAGKEIVKRNGEYIFYDITPGVITNSMTPGSVVKGASMLVGYNTGAISIGEYQKDECIKLYSKPAKCSWKKLGNINDITALAESSNIYQFKTAMKVAGFKYFYNARLNDVKEAFDIYRTTFNEFGLGVKTEIDLPIDGVGNIGQKNDADLYLNYVIGQYDTYSTMQLSSYISTIATKGVRYKPHLLKEVHKSNGEDGKLGSLIKTVAPEILGKVTTKEEYIDRVRLGFSEVMNTGLGKGFMGNVSKPAGKTGTSESYMDTDGDGIIDTPTLSNAFVGYYPSDNPKMSIAISFPNLVNSHTYDKRSYANKRITKRISNKFFELYG